MTSTKSKAPLLSAHDIADAYTSALELQDVEVAGGITVRVRAISKRTQMRLAKIDPESSPENADRFQVELFRAGVMTDGDELTVEQVESIVDTWPAGAFDAVLEAIMEVSGQSPTFRPGNEDRDGAGE